MKKKVPILLFLRILGFSNKKIIYTLKDLSFLESLGSFSFGCFQELLFDLKAILGVNKAGSIFVSNNYDLGDVGRQSLNQKLFLTNFYIKESHLVPEDILGALSNLMKLNKGTGLSDDIDDLKNKRIRGSGELLINHINLNFSDVVKPLKSKLDQISEKSRNNRNFLRNLEASDIIESKLFTNLVKKFFLNNQLSQILEDINPLAEVSHKRKVCSFGVGAIDRNRASLKIREIHPSHFGRICPIETTEGKNAGLILSFAKDVEINDNGFIETPFYLRLISIFIKKFSPD